MSICPPTGNSQVAYSCGHVFHPLKKYYTEILNSKSGLATIVMDPLGDIYIAPHMQVGQLKLGKWIKLSKLFFNLLKIDYNTSAYYI